MTQPILTVQQAIRCLPPGPIVHTLRLPGCGFIKRDQWTRAQMLELLKHAVRIDIAGPNMRNLGHGLAVLTPADQAVFVAHRLSGRSNAYLDEIDPKDERARDMLERKAIDHMKHATGWPRMYRNHYVTGEPVAAIDYAVMRGWMVERAPDHSCLGDGQELFQVTDAGKGKIACDPTTTAFDYANVGEQPERLRATTVNEAVERYLEEEWDPAVPRQLSVVLYRRNDASDDDLVSLADAMWECLSDNVYEDERLGPDPDGGSVEDNLRLAEIQELKADLREVARKFFTHYEPFYCEPFATVEVDTKEWVRKNRPGWIEGGAS